MTPPEILDILSRHRSEKILECVAANPSTATYTLTRLAGHQSAEVCMAVAENINTQFSDLAFLAFHENPDVRFRLAENPLLPVRLLEELAQDDNPYICKRAQCTLTLALATERGAATTNKDTLPLPHQSGSRGDRRHG